MAIHCPACKAPLTDDEVASIVGASSSAKRKRKAGGHLGGRKRKEDASDPRKPTANPALQPSPPRPAIIAKLASEIEEIKERTHLVAFDDLEF